MVFKRNIKADHSTPGFKWWPTDEGGSRRAALCELAAADQEAVCACLDPVACARLHRDIECFPKSPGPAWHTRTQRVQRLSLGLSNHAHLAVLADEHAHPA